MQKLISAAPALFPLFFVCMWLGITTLLSAKSGWLTLMVQFPDRRENATQVFRGRSGSMRGVSIRGLLRISVCPSGLRFGMNRLFGVLSRDFFVPWNQLKVASVTTWYMKRSQFQFMVGASMVGEVTMAPETVARIGVSAVGMAPPGMFLPAEPNHQVGKRLFVQWLIATLFAGAFFTLVPRFAFQFLPLPSGAHVHAAADPYPPWPVTVLFPAIVFGIAAIVAYMRDRSQKNQQRSNRPGAK